MIRFDRRILIEAVLAAAAGVFAVAFFLGVGGTVSVKTKVVDRTKTVVKVVPQPGVAVGERSFSLNLPQEQAVFPDPAQVANQPMGSGPSWAQTSLSYMVGPTLVQVISARLNPVEMKVSAALWARSVKEPYAIDKRPYSVQGHPGYLYVNKTQAYLQLVLATRIKAQMYMIMVGDPLPKTEAQELPKLNDIIAGLKLNPAPTPLPKPTFKQVCDGAKFQLQHYSTQGLTLKEAQERVKTVCNPNSEFWKHENGKTTTRAKAKHSVHIKIIAKSGSATTKTVPSKKK